MVAVLEKIDASNVFQSCFEWFHRYGANLKPFFFFANHSLYKK